jgi:hypothetical protein
MNSAYAGWRIQESALVRSWVEPLRLRKQASQLLDLPRLIRFQRIEPQTTALLGGARTSASLTESDDEAVEAFNRAASLTDDPALREYLLQARC